MTAQDIGASRHERAGSALQSFHDNSSREFRDLGLPVRVRVRVPVRLLMSVQKILVRGQEVAAGALSAVQDDGRPPHLEVLETGPRILPPWRQTRNLDFKDCLRLPLGLLPILFDGKRTLNLSRRLLEVDHVAVEADLVAVVDVSHQLEVGL